MPRVKDFKIILDEPDKLYFAGDVLTGRVRLEIVEKELELRAVRIKFKGKGKVSWSETHGDQEEYYSDSEVYFKYTQTLFGKESGDKGGNEILPVGEHFFMFTYTLPNLHLPSSFEAKHGHIRYNIKANIDRPWKIDNKHKVPFKVVETVDAKIPEFLEPEELDQEDHYCCCCCKSGPVKATSKIERSGYNQGETIKVFIDVENGDSDPVRDVNIKLEQKTVHHADGNTKKNKKYIAESTTRIDVPANDTKRIDNLSITIPNDIVPTMIHSTVLEVTYLLEVTVAMHEFNYGIVIGSVRPQPGGTVMPGGAPYAMPIIAQPGPTPYPPYPPVNQPPYPTPDAYPPPPVAYPPPSAPYPPPAAYPPSSAANSTGLDPAQYPPVQPFGIPMEPLPSVSPPTYEETTKDKI